MNSSRTHTSSLSRLAILATTSFFSGCVDYSVVKQQIEDSFLQLDRDADIDILWVVDNSATMSEEQAQLAAHTSSFSSVIGLLARGFHMGITTTDVEAGPAGLLVDEVLSDDTPALDQALVDQVSSLERGSRDEQGFTAAIAAADPGGVNADFGRSDSDLEVIFYADEDDQSDHDPQDFLTQLGVSRPGRGVSVSAVVGDPPDGCFSRVAAADPGMRYIAAQEASAGQRASICTDDLDTVLSRIAMWALQIEDTFFLSAMPSPASLEVRVDAALLPERDSNGWSYNAADNSIRFQGYAVPPPGASIKIRYDEWLGTSEDTSSQAEE